MQPGTGIEARLAYSSMTRTRESKSKKPAAQIRKVLARNVVILRDVVYANLSTPTKRNEQLAKDIGSSLAQMQRICAGELGTSIDTVEWLANALGVRPLDLLTPGLTISKAAPRSVALHRDAADEAPLQRPGSR